LRYAEPSGNPTDLAKKAFRSFPHKRRRIVGRVSTRGRTVIEPKNYEKRSGCARRIWRLQEHFCSEEWGAACGRSSGVSGDTACRPFSPNHSKLLMVYDGKGTLRPPGTGSRSPMLVGRMLFGAGRKQRVTRTGYSMKMVRCRLRPKSLIGK
jgi:hypothetical protein